MRKQLRKLSLSAETLRNLDRTNLREIAGGSAVATNCPLLCSAANCTATYACSGCEPCA